MEGMSPSVDLILKINLDLYRAKKSILNYVILFVPVKNQ